MNETNSTEIEELVNQLVCLLETLKNLKPDTNALVKKLSEYPEQSIEILLAMTGFCFCENPDA